MAGLNPCGDLAMGSRCSLIEPTWEGGRKQLTPPELSHEQEASLSISLGLGPAWFFQRAWVKTSITEKQFVG